jgi:hypothetical protein
MRGRGRLRASDADREKVIDTLKVAFVQGRLTMDELDTRAGLALASQTYAELAVITADLPSGLTEDQPPSKPAQAHTRSPVAKKVAAWGAAAIILPAVGAAFLTYYGGFIVLFVLAFIGVTVTAQP